MKARSRAIALLCLLVACAEPPPRTPIAEADFAIVDVTVVPMRREEELPHRTVLVLGDRIVSVESSGISLPNGIRKIDGRGKFLIPGLADMHAHLDRASLPLYVARGVTTVRNMAGRAKHLAWRKQISKGTLVGPTIITAGRILDGNPPDYRGMAAVTTRAEADAEVERGWRAGYDFVKILQALSPDAYDNVVASARAHGLRVMGHVPNEVPLAHAIESKQDSIEHLTGYFQAIQRDDSPYAKLEAKYDAKRRLRLGDFIDDAKLRSIALATRDAGVWNCPTLLAFESNADLAPGQTHPRAKEVDRYLSDVQRALWQPANNAWEPKEPNEEDKAAGLRKLAARRKIVKALHDGGALLLAGTDNPSFEVPGYSLVDEIMLLAASGLTNYEALAAATIRAEQFLYHRDAGIIEPGAIADLALLSGDPLIDLHHLDEVEGVALRGKWFSEIDLRALEEKSAAIAKRSAHPPASLGEEGGETFSWRYEINGVTAGFESLNLKTDPSWTKIATAQSIVEPVGADDVRVWMVVDRKGFFQHGRLERHGDEEAGDLLFKLVGQTARAVGRFPIDGLVAMDRKVDPATFFLVPTQASYVALAQRVSTLGVHTSIQLKALIFSMDGGPDDFELRLPEDGTIDVSRSDAHTFEIDVAAPNGRYHAQMITDDKDIPTTVTIDRQEFEERRVRVTSPP